MDQTHEDRLLAEQQELFTEDSSLVILHSLFILQSFLPFFLLMNHLLFLGDLHPEFIETTLFL